MSLKQPFMLGLYQPAAKKESLEDRLNRLARIFDEPSVRACDLMVCPELFLSGYFVDDEIRNNAQSMDGPFANAVSTLAKKWGCAIAYGYPERGDGKIYNSVLCMGKDGELLANHRKTFLPHDYEKKYFTTGDKITTIEINGWKIGLLVCYEVEFPETVRHYAQRGCEVVIAPTALTKQWPIVARSLIPTRAFENGIFVAYSNHAGMENGSEYLGESVIVSPLGTELARAGSSEAIITAELDYSEIERHRERLHFLEDIEHSCYH